MATIVNRSGLAGSRSCLTRMGGNRGGAEFSPLDLSPTAWWRSDLGVTIDTGVNQWADQSGNGHTFGQSTPSLQPARNTSDADFGGKPSIQFDGTDDYLQTGLTITLGSAFDIFLVGKIAAGASASGCVHDLNGTGGRQYVLNSEHTTTRAGVTSAYGFTTNLKDLTGTHTWNHRCNSTHATDLWYDNEVQDVGSPIQTNNPSGNVTSANYTLAATNSAGLPNNAKFAEVIIYNTLLSAPNRALVLAYLKARYSHY